MRKIESIRKCYIDIKGSFIIKSTYLLPKKVLLVNEVNLLCFQESVDTPIVERRKSSNWFTRQISRTRMGSIRSASTAYSSGGLFSRHRGNSVYASPETGQLPGAHPPPKMSIYDRLVGRRSGRNQRLTKQGIYVLYRLKCLMHTKRLASLPLGASGGQGSTVQ